MKMLRKILCMIVAAAMVCSSWISVAAQGGQTVQEGNFQYRIADGKAELIGYSASGSSEVTVPTSVQSYPVVAIGDEAFRNLSGITKITLGEGITRIGDRAFYACADLKSIALPRSLQSIGEMGFCNCYSLTSITIPEKVQAIGLSAFSNCISLTSISISASNPYYLAKDNVIFSKDMTQLVFYLNTKADKTYTIPAQVTTIGEKAFQWSTNLETVNYPAGLTGIGKYAFAECTGLKAVQLPDTVTSLGAFAFKGCGALTKAVLGAGLKTVPSYAFSDCGSLSEVSYSDEMQRIETNAFAGCTGIKNIVIPDTVTHIGKDAFSVSTIQQVRFYSTQQKNTYAALFPDSEIICICKAEHRYEASDLSDCVVCDYVRDLKSPPELAEKTHESVVLKAESGFEYSIDMVSWQQSSAFTGLSANTEYRFYRRIAATGTTGAGQASDPLIVTTRKLPQEKAQPPVILSRDESSATLQAVDGHEYSVDGVTWQSSPVFSGLDPYEEYHFYQRKVETDTHEASPSSDGVFSAAVLVGRISSTVYTIGENTISKVPTGTTVATLLSGIKGGQYCRLVKGTKVLSNTDVVGTGMVLQVVNGTTVVKAYTMIVTGDTNGDGDITITDMIAVKAHILKKTILTGVYAVAGDTNGDGNITITDFIQIKAKILGKGSITAR